MKTYLLIAVMCIPAILQAQRASISDYLDGGKTLIELIKVIKPQKTALSAASYSSPDSCVVRKKSDISYKNKTEKTMLVSLYFRAGNIYEPQPLSIMLAPSSQESLYDIRSGIYKYKIETDLNGLRAVLHEGELKLLPCESFVKEIKG